MADKIQIHDDDDPWIIYVVPGERVEVWCGDAQLDHPEQLSADFARRMGEQLLIAAHRLSGGVTGTSNFLRLGRLRTLAENHRAPAEDGGRVDVDAVWPSQILTILDGE